MEEKMYVIGAADGDTYAAGPLPLKELLRGHSGDEGMFVWDLEEGVPVMRWDTESLEWVNYIKSSEGEVKIPTDFVRLWNHDAKPRRAQLDVLSWLTDQTAKYCIVEAPTGVGKSFICLTVCNDGGGIVLTPQITLQEQYLSDFDYMDLIMSSDNYRCQKSKAAERGQEGYLSCKRGASICNREKCLGSCPYVKAKERFLATTHGIANYAYFWRFVKIPELRLEQNWIILDEAHNLEQSLIDSALVEITEKWCEDNRFRYQKPRSDAEAIRSLLSLADEVSKRAAEYRLQLDMFEKNGDTSSILKTLDDLNPLEEWLTSADFALGVLTKDVDGKPLYQHPKFDSDMLASHGLVVIRSEPDSRSEFFSFKPLYAKHIWETLPDFVKEKRFFITSATILNVNQFIKNIGWDKKDVAFMSLDSPFDEDNRKVYMKGRTSLNRSNLEYEFPNVVKAADKYLDQFDDMRGVIHTHTFKLAEEFARLSRHKGRLVVHQPKMDRVKLLNEFLTSDEKDLILVSPSVTEGLDLKDDLGRFAIFLKVPYPSMGDPWVKARMEADRSWYSWQVAKTIIQGCGRVVRSRKDWGFSIFLDGGFQSFIQREGKLFPDWFIESIRT